MFANVLNSCNNQTLILLIVILILILIIIFIFINIKMNQPAITIINCHRHSRHCLFPLRHHHFHSHQYHNAPSIDIINCHHRCRHISYLILIIIIIIRSHQIIMHQLSLIVFVNLITIIIMIMIWNVHSCCGFVGQSKTWDFVRSQREPSFKLANQITHHPVLNHDHDHDHHHWTFDKSISFHPSHHGDDDDMGVRETLAIGLEALSQGVSDRELEDAIIFSIFPGLIIKGVF